MSSTAPTFDLAEDDPVLAAFARAPTDDRLETDEEHKAVEAAKASARVSGRMLSHPEVVGTIERMRSIFEGHRRLRTRP